MRLKVADLVSGSLSIGSKYSINYPLDVGDEEWAFVAPYLALCREDVPQREHSLRAVFNGLRYIARTGNQWRLMPGDRPWTVTRRSARIRAGVFEVIVEDLRSAVLGLRVAVTGDVLPSILRS